MNGKGFTVLYLKFVESCFFTFARAIPKYFLGAKV